MDHHTGARAAGSVRAPHRRPDDRAAGAAADLDGALAVAVEAHGAGLVAATTIHGQADGAVLLDVSLLQPTVGHVHQLHPFPAIVAYGAAGTGRRSEHEAGGVHGEHSGDTTALGVEGPEQLEHVAGAAL